MGRLFDNYRIPEEGRIRDKTMLYHVIATVVIIVVCLVAMSVTALAYFSHGVSTSYNIIQTAHFDISVSADDGTAPVEITKSEGGYTFTVKAGVDYIITLEPKGDAQTGFATVEVAGVGDVYHTVQLGADRLLPTGYNDLLTFKVRLSTDSDVNESTVSMIPHWGTSSHYDSYAQTSIDTEFYITEGELVEVVVQTQQTELTMQEQVQDDPSVDDAQGTPPADEGDDASDDDGGNAPSDEEIVHTVVLGDTMTNIAERYSTTVDRLLVYNGLDDPDYIYTGQRIRIPPASWEDETQPDQ